MENILSKEVDLINDEEFIYDIKFHRYKLTIKALKTQGIDIVVSEGSQEKAKAHLNRISLIVYNYMYSKLLRNDKRVLEFRLSRDTELALELKEAMIQLTTSDTFTHASEIYYEHGIDSNTSREDLMSGRVPPIVEDILRNGTLLSRNYRQTISTELLRVGY